MSARSGPAAQSACFAPLAPGQAPPPAPALEARPARRELLPCSAACPLRAARDRLPRPSPRRPPLPGRPPAAEGEARGPTFEDLTLDDTLNDLERVEVYGDSHIALQRLVHVRLLAEVAETYG